MYNILICDDEKDIVSALKIYLESEGYSTICAYNGAQAVEAVCNNDIQLVVMDIMMPIMDGISAMVKIREISNVPIILLTAKSEDTDKVLGLNVGADDYITKPFNPVEMLARVKSQLRRYTQLGCNSGSTVKDKSIINCGGIMIDDKAKDVFIDGEKILLTPTEYEILKLMMKRNGEVISPAEIYKSVWNAPAIGTESTVAVHIRHLREKIEINPAEPRYIKVVWGQGYKFEGDKQ